MEHLERTLIEILRRLGEAERKITSLGKPKKTTVTLSGVSSSVGSNNDHRFLENLNSEMYTHLTRAEYNALKNLNNDHGALFGLGDNDHPQYILHALAQAEWDVLAADNTRHFVKKSIDQIRQKIAAKLFPAEDSTEAVMVYKSNGTTPIVTVDTSNSRVGIGIQPDTALHVRGDIKTTNGNIQMDSQVRAVINSNKSMLISADGDLTLNPTGSVAVNRTIRSNVYGIDNVGWQVNPQGDANFRNMRVNKINARIVSTGIEQFVGGRQTMCKSASPLATNFSVPLPGDSELMGIEPFADYPYEKVFDDGDIVRVVYVSLYDGKYNTADCWGTVAAYVGIVGNDIQLYTFTRSTAPNSGSAQAGTVIEAGELALNYGTSGSGYMVSTVI